MKILRKILDRSKPLFEKEGKFHFLKASFEAIDTFLFVPNKTTQTGTHIRDAIDLKRAMFFVIIALLPALLFGLWNIGYQHYIAIGELNLHSTIDLFWFGFLKFLPIVVVSYVVGLTIEFIFAEARGHEVSEGFLVSGLLIPLIMPIEASLWMVAVSTAFAVIIGKEIFGGTGMNIWNPALLARVFYFFAYPSKISGDNVWIADKPDSFSGATPLADAAALADANPKQLDLLTDKLSNTWDMFIGTISGSVGETSTLAILVGAVILLFTGIASFRIMFSVFIGGYIIGLIFNIFGVNPYMTEMPAWQHLIMGGFAFGAVFMATDPVTATQTNTGKWIYGFLIGFFAILTRVMNKGFPESMMLAILFMNTFAPMIDYLVVNANIKKRLKRIKNKAIP